MPDDVPPPLPRQSQLARASLLLGILANMILPIVASIPGILCGHLALRAMRRDPHLQGRGMAVAGLWLGYVSVAASILLGLLWMILLPLMEEALPLLRQNF